MRLRTCLIALALAAGSLPGLALDNPDAPDLLAAFEARAQPLESRIAAAANDSLAQAATREYELFLDQELNRAYGALLARLGPDARRDLVQAQKRWLAYRDAEARFIGTEWTLQNFGSSSALSRGAYRATLVKQRTTSLLHYLKNFPAADAAASAPRR